jgi:hypothetical protein
MSAQVTSQSVALMDADEARLPVPRLIVGIDEKGNPAWGFAAVPAEVGKAQLRDLFGTVSDAFVCGQLDALFHTFSQGLGRPPEQAQLEAALALIAGVRPRNELEAALAVQMAATHAIALRLNRRLMKTDPVMSDFLDAGIIASKFMRAFAAQVEALSRLRRPAMQVVRVERIDISHGGQAVIGNISRGEGAPGGPEFSARNPKKRGEPS